MKKEERINAVLKSMKSFSKEKYRKEEYLDELYNLQNDLVNVTFNNTHQEEGKLRVWDVYNHLSKLNERNNGVASEELYNFKNDCFSICEAISAEVSGRKGEYKAFRSLETLDCENKVLKNVEFMLGDHRTELDAIVFTKKAIFIIEVKNTGKNINIDEQGNYCRITDIVNYDSNIGEKMNDKVYLLRKALESSKIENINIEQFLLFTNSKITVNNNYPYIKECFLGTLTHIIEDYDGDDIYSMDDIENMISCVNESKVKEAYEPPFDVKIIKSNFANLISLLEESNSEEDEEKDNWFSNVFDENFKHDIGKVALGALGSFAISSLIKKFHSNKGGKH